MIRLTAAAVLLGALALTAATPAAADRTLLNVSYDPTRELYQEFNALFAKDWADKTGETVQIRMSHGGSGKQARAVIDRHGQVRGELIGVVCRHHSPGRSRRAGRGDLVLARRSMSSSHHKNGTTSRHIEVVVLSSTRELWTRFILLFDSESSRLGETLHQE